MGRVLHGDVFLCDAYTALTQILFVWIVSVVICCFGYLGAAVIKVVVVLVVMVKLMTSILGLAA